MEKMIINVELKKGSTGDDVIDFRFGAESHSINLNSERQDGLKLLFFKLIEAAIENELEFKIDYDASVFLPDSYLVEMCNEYVEQLKNEIKTIQKDYEESGLKEEQDDLGQA